MKKKLRNGIGGDDDGELGGDGDLEGGIGDGAMRLEMEVLRLRTIDLQRKLR